MFFDRAKKALETREVYDEFLKLLSLFHKDVIDAKTLAKRAQVFLGDGELLAQLKELMGLDDKAESVEHGPPGSVRTGPPEALSAVIMDDGEGPSYRKLPESVSGFQISDAWIPHEYTRRRYVWHVQAATNYAAQS